MNPHNAGLDPSDTEYDHSPPIDNVYYTPAHHPVTGEPGFMITYPLDIHFSSFETKIPANQLLRLLRRQLHWAKKESEELKKENASLKRLKRDEWVKKEALLEGVMEAELAAGRERGVLGEDEMREMEKDVETAKDLSWTSRPWWKARGFNGYTKSKTEEMADEDSEGSDSDENDEDEDMDTEEGVAETNGHTERLQQQEAVESESRFRQEKDDDMMAVGALMGLSAANA